MSDDQTPERPQPRFGEYADPEPRPRPQYGEYASTEEQLASIKDPTARELARPEPPVVPPPVVPPEQRMPLYGPPRDPDASVGRALEPERSTRPLDRAATFLLLAFGLFNVLLNIPSFLNFSSTVDQTMQQAGIGSFSNTAEADALGIVLLVIYCVLWLAALVLSMLSMRKGRVTFWIPLVAGILATIATTVFALILVAGDPAFIDYINKSTSP